MSTLTQDLRGGQRVTIEECKTGSWEGGNVWPPAHELVESLNTEIALNSSQLAVSSVLELGAGWGLVGYCPGPALAALSSGSSATATFVVAMIAGWFISQRWSI